MKGWTKAVQVFEKVKESKLSKKYQYFLLELDILGEKLNISAYTKNQEQKAIERYAEIEKMNTGKKEFDVVLVGVDTANDLKKPYPPLRSILSMKEFLKK